MLSYPCTRTTGTGRWLTVTSSGTAAWRWRSGCTVPCATRPNFIACRQPWPWRSWCTAGWSGGSGSRARPVGPPRSRPTGHDVTPSSSSAAAAAAATAHRPPASNAAARTGPGGPVRPRGGPGRPGRGHHRISVHDRTEKPQKLQKKNPPPSLPLPRPTCNY